MNWSGRTVIVAVLCVFVAAVIGVVAGDWYVQWRQSNARHDRLQQLYTNGTVRLTAGNLFPEVELIDLEGNRATPATIRGGREAIVFFVAPGCDPCAELIGTYRREVGSVAPYTAIFAVCPVDPETARSYARQYDLPFPLYCDTAHIFQSEYGMVAFPSLVTVGADGHVRIVDLGMLMEDYSLSELFRDVSQR